MAGIEEALLHEIQRLDRKIGDVQSLLAPRLGFPTGPEAQVGPNEPWTEELDLDLSESRDRELVRMRLPSAISIVVRNPADLDGVSITAWLDDPSGPGFQLLDYRVLQFRFAFRYLYLSHGAYAGRRLRLQLSGLRLARVEPRDIGLMTVGVRLELENDLVRAAIDLTVARNNQPLGLAGTSLFIADIGGADWQMRLSSPTASLIYSTDLGARFTIEDLAFSEIYFTNAAAPAGTAPVIFLIGRRV